MGHKGSIVVFRGNCADSRSFKIEMSPINLDRIQSWIDQGRLNPDEPITMKELAKSRCLHGVKRHGVKLLARVRSLSFLPTSPPQLGLGLKHGVRRYQGRLPD